MKKYKNLRFFESMQIIRHMCSKNNKVYDIVIVGGGMVGTTLACALANNRRLESKKILLLEGDNNKYELNEQYSNRVIALNKHSKSLLSSIGAWKHIESKFAPVYKIQVWDACSDAIITFNRDNALQELAYITENDLVIHAVHTELSKKKFITVFNNAKVEQIILTKNVGTNSKIYLNTGENFTAKLLIGADGQKSKVRQVMDSRYVDWEYDQMGIVATVKLSETAENIVAWQRFLPSGSIALLPLTDSLSSLVWCITTAEAKRLLNASDEEFVDNLNNAFWKVYPKDDIIKGGMEAFQKVLESVHFQTGVLKQLQPSIANIIKGSRAAFPLGFGHAVHYVQPGVALVGDAAHKINPLAGQGVNLGFGDITALVQVLAEAVNNGALIEDITYLHKYESFRQWHNIPTMLAVDILYRLYKRTAPPIVLARSLGLELTNAVKPLKKILMQHAADCKRNSW